MVGDDIALDEPFSDGWNVVAGGPYQRDQLLAEQIALAREALEGGITIAIVFVADDVEIVLPACDRQVSTPPIFDPLVFDGVARLKSPDLVRAAAERRIQRALLEGAPGIIGTRENRQPGDEQWQVARVTGGKAHYYASFVRRLHARKVAQQLLDDRMALLFQHLQ